MAIPTGTVTLYGGAAPPGGNAFFVADLDPTGAYSVQSNVMTQAVSSGNPVYAVYSGDATHQASTSVVVLDVVNSPIAATTTTLNISPNPAMLGDQQMFTGTVS